MKKEIVCNNCKHTNTVALKNFSKEQLQKLNNKAIAFKCRSCGELLKMQIKIS